MNEDKSINVSVMRYNQVDKAFRSCLSVKLDMLPRVGEKVIMKIEGSSFVMEVLDLHHNLLNNSVDIYVINEEPYDTYKLAVDRRYS